MSDYEHVILEREDGVGIITMNRPESMNALNSKMSNEIKAAARLLDEDEEIGCIVLTGAGNRAFTAGGDIFEQKANDEKFSQEELDERNAKRSREGFEMATALTPIIAMMNGLAYGGGAVLASQVDMRIGCENTKFRFLAAAYARINSTWTLPNQVGWPMAKELLYTARIVEAEEAYRIGLLNHLVPSGELRAKTMEIARMIAKNDRASVRGIKQLLQDGYGENLETQWGNERDFTTNVLRGSKAADAFPDFLARKGG